MSDIVMPKKHVLCYINFILIFLYIWYRFIQMDT